VATVVSAFGDVLGDALVRPGRVAVHLVHGQLGAQVRLTEKPRMQSPPSTRKPRLPSAEDHPGITPGSDGSPIRVHPRTLPSNGHQPSPTGVLYTNSWDATS
jgi:hypothetical protein